MAEQQSEMNQKPEQKQPQSSAQPVSQPATPSPSQPASTEVPKKKNTTLIILLVLFVVLLLPCCACGALAIFSRATFEDVVLETVDENLNTNFLEEVVEKGIENGSNEDVDIDLDEGQFTWDSEDGSGSMGTVSEWPDSVPSVVPEFTYGDITYAISYDDASGTGWSMSFENVDADAFDSYTSDLEDAGWTITGTYSAEGTSTLIGENGSWSVSCSCTESDQMCQVIVEEVTE